MNTIHLEHFEAWLLKQDPARTFDYTLPNACMLCSFLKETYQGHWLVGLTDFSEFGVESITDNNLPEWAIKMLNNFYYGGIRRNDLLSMSAPTVNVADALAWLRSKGMISTEPDAVAKETNTKLWLREESNEC